ncbi:MAG TPA: stringent starvation protein A [Gammaproteobacteria bacterium]|nr:stringent starvation protein A [Gammaproteobacteria bacterium]
MAVIANRRSVMTLFSNASCPHSHRVRMVLAEKGITVEIVNVDPDNLPEDLIDLNPYQSVPTLVDRELVLYDPQVITEYLDERFPHPPLMPVDPVSRARSRLALYRIQRDWYSLLGDLESGTEKVAAKARKTLRDSLASSAEVFAARPYFLSDDFSLVDATIAPVLWRLKYYRIELPSQAAPVMDYARRLFERESFQASLTEVERELCE